MSGKREYGKHGYIDFSKLWEYMKKHHINKEYLYRHGIHKTSIYKMQNNENVTCEVIARLCYILNTQPSKILEYRPPAQETE